MTIKEGDTLPEVTLHHMTEKGPTPITSSELFGGKKTVLFAVPGAFTPGCSMQHLPGFVTNSQEILDKGADQIVCLSVNDAFVMDAWGKDKGAEKILMLGDGNGDFTKAMGLEADKSGGRMGMRCTRFAAIIDNGVVKTLNVDNKGLDVSSAETILAAL